MEMVQVHECIQCRKQSVQHKWICPNCKNSEFQTKEIDGVGEVYTHTTIYVSSKELSHLTPYTVALIELQNGVRLTGRIMNKVEIGDQVMCVSSEGIRYTFEKLT